MVRGKKREQTPEEILNERIERFIKEKRFYGIIPPTRFFKIGDKVNIGNIQNPVIHDIIDIDGISGVAYVVKYDNIPTEGQQKFTPQYGKLTIWDWYDVFAPNDEPLIFKEGYRLNFMNTGLSYLISVYMRNDIDMEPSYQRDYVWTQKDKEELITSIFSGIEIGRFVVKRREWDEREPKGYEIVDGKQRMNAIMEFFMGKFKWNGKYYHELHGLDRYRFKDYGIAVCELRESVTKEELLEIFIRINTFGKTMPKEQIEKVQKMLDEK